MHSSRKERLGFASYDFSNSGYVAVFQSFLFPLVLKSGAEGTGHSITVLWAVAVTASSLAAVILAPFVGRLADQIGKARVFSVTVVITAVFAMLAPPLFSGFVLTLTACFIFFNLFFELSQSLYDSFLSNLEETISGITNLSSFAWGFGYLGGALFAAIYFGFSYLGVSQVWMLSIFAFLYLLLSLPAIFGFYQLQSAKVAPLTALSLRDIVNVKTPVPWRDLLIYWIIADTVAAIMYFTPIYLSEELGFSIKVIGGLMLGGQLLAFPVTIFMGKLANKFGRLKTIRVGLIIWALSVIGLAFAQTILHVVIILVGLSFVIGSTQAILRAHFASRVNVKKSGEGLGFFAIAQKSASVISPALVAGLLLATGSLRPSFLLLGILLIIAFFVAVRLPDKQFTK